MAKNPAKLEDGAIKDGSETEGRVEENIINEMKNYYRILGRGVARSDSDLMESLCSVEKRLKEGLERWKQKAHLVSTTII